MVTKRKTAPESDRAKVGKLELNKETVKDLPANDMKNVKGGWIRPPISWTCPQPTEYGTCRCPVDKG